MKKLVIICFLISLSLFSKAGNGLNEKKQEIKLSLTKINSFLLEDENCILKSPYLFIVNKENDIYVFDTGDKKVIKYNNTGKHLLNFGKKGQGPGEFQSAFGLAVDKDNHILIPDGKYINIFDSEGRFKSKIRMKHKLAQLRDVQVYDNGYFIRNSLAKDELYFNNVDRLDKNFNYVNTVYKKSIKPSEFKEKSEELLYPYTIDFKGNVYVAENARSEYHILKFDLNGKKLYEIKKNSTRALRSKEKIKEIKDYLKRKIKDKKEFVKKMEIYKYKLTILNLYVDPFNRLWIITSSEKQKDNFLYLDVYSDLGKFLSRIKLENVNSPVIRVKNNKLYVMDTDPTNELNIQIYQIVNNK